ncbi:hypothetical protein [Paraburkholderia phenazinium]|uniref:hypothetical protein n=1 Tax=Paraburkholderia phenazinium TaxID=60549 RepID=UPI00158D735B|nr:hypothetical protein [Paraburkholderia phenazinium]
MALLSNREISQKLTRYAHFLESEISRFEATSALMRLDPDAYIGLAEELRQTREMVEFLARQPEPS